MSGNFTVDWVWYNEINHNVTQLWYLKNLHSYKIRLVETPVEDLVEISVEDNKKLTTNIYMDCLCNLLFDFDFDFVFFNINRYNLKSYRNRENLYGSSGKGTTLIQVTIKNHIHKFIYLDDFFYYHHKNKIMRKYIKKNDMKKVMYTLAGGKVIYKRNILRCYFLIPDNLSRFSIKFTEFTHPNKFEIEWVKIEKLIADAKHLLVKDTGEDDSDNPESLFGK